MKQDAQAGLQILGSGREGGRKGRGGMAAPHGLGGTALAPQLQPLLCSLVCEINAPHLLFLLPGNRARQRITPGGLFSPARFPGTDTWNIKHDELFPLGQVTEQLPSAQLEPPPAPRSSPASFSHPTLPAAALRCSQTAGKIHGDFFPLGRAGASPCCQAAAPLLSFLGCPRVPRSLSPGRGEGSAIHLPHALRRQR